MHQNDFKTQKKIKKINFLKNTFKIQKSIFLVNELLNTWKKNIIKNA
jgi:hypothetical protein